MRCTQEFKRVYRGYCDQICKWIVKSESWLRPGLWHDRCLMSFVVRSSTLWHYFDLLSKTKKGILRLILHFFLFTLWLTGWTFISNQKDYEGIVGFMDPYRKCTVCGNSWILSQTWDHPSVTPFGKRWKVSTKKRPLPLSPCRRLSLFSL